MDLNRLNWFNNFDEMDGQYSPWKTTYTQTDDPFGSRSAYESFQKRRNSLFNRSMSSSRSRTYSNTSTSPSMRDFIHCNDEYKICVNVQQFRPDEITIQCNDHLIIVDARHEEREDEFGLVSRQFTRKYILPKEYNPTDLVSVLNSEGILVIRAPLPPQKEVETVIKVQHLDNRENPNIYK